jgi:hypothetical protein
VPDDQALDDRPSDDQALAGPDTVLVVDFGAQYAQLIARRVRELDVYSEIVPHRITAAEVRANPPAALILSGGPKSVHVDGAPSLDPEIYDLGIPILGICYGVQLTALSFGGKVVPQKQQKEWTALVSMKTGEPIASVSADDPGGFALGLGNKILGPLGAQWFYEGVSLGYRTLYVWFADEDLMITVQTNSQPPEGTDKVHDAVSALYEIVKKRLKPNGIFGTIILSSDSQNLFSMVMALKQSFRYVRLFEPYGEHNIYQVVASESPIPNRNAEELARRMPEDTKKDLTEWIDSTPRSFPDTVQGMYQRLLDTEIDTADFLGKHEPWQRIPLTDDKPVNEYFFLRRTLLSGWR